MIKYSRIRPLGAHSTEPVLRCSTLLPNKMQCPKGGIWVREATSVDEKDKTKESTEYTQHCHAHARFQLAADKKVEHEITIIDPDNTKPEKVGTELEVVTQPEVKTEPTKPAQLIKPEEKKVVTNVNNASNLNIAK